MLFSVHENPDPQCSDHDHHLDPSSSTTFSIRDYVLSARSKKDIKTSWPFSLKNLKLCLKHGVKDVLPPFQSVDAIRKLEPPQGTIAASIPSSVSQSESARPSHHRQPRGPGNKSKCKVIVNSSEDIASNSTTQLSEAAMASKICPVCKTFSSSSNTTLNAHIDQCLSAESSTPNWTLDSSKVGPRHRVKPRKTRLMVDIYVTAFPCTLEDLDRRNGSNWASGGPSSFPSESDKGEEKCADVDVGAVYINSNGIKVRILSSKPDEPRVSKLADHLRPTNPFKGAKFLSARKKKRRASKLTHYFKLAQTKKLLPRSSQVCGGGGGKRQMGEGSYDVQKPGSKTETLRQWARCKRSGLAKNNPNPLAETRRRDLSVSLPEKIFYEAQERHVVEKDETWSSLAERSVRPLRKERTPRMLKSASFSTAVPDPTDTRTSIELDRSKSVRVSSVRSHMSSDVCLRRDEERVLPWNPPRRNTARTEILPFHQQRSHRVDPINVSRFSTKLAVDSEMLTGLSGPNFVDGQDQEMFYGVGLGNDMMVEDLNAYVDPIPIPGPPGSFLPSPRDMSSEEFQANSSLTTSRVQSSLDQRDGDSSATSTVSNSTGSRYEDDVAPPPPRNSSTRSEERLLKMGMGVEPCCCQRKERGFQELLKRRAAVEATPNPVLRLMGKNLIVGNRDPFYPPPEPPAANGWARVDPHSHLYKSQNTSFL